MAFLIPALCAVCSDIFLLYLNHQYRIEARNVEPGESEPSYIVHVRYLAPLAVIRLLLVLFPLTFHSYTGTAIKWPVLYHILYVTTILCVLIHTLSIIMLDPRSISSFLPNTPNRMLLEGKSYYDAQHRYMMRRVWIELSLTLWSTCWHCVLLWHVRSTAPSHGQQRKQALRAHRAASCSSSGSAHVLYYYASQQQERQHEEEDDDEKKEHTFLLQAGQPTEQRKHDLITQMKCLPENYDEFVSDLQQRLKATKQQWAERLEEVTSRMSTTTSTHAAARSRESVGSTAASTFSSPFSFSTSPFRVLLQLFAYEEVLSNNRLDAVFESDGGENMTFYVPQLLSFLLYGAYHNSPTLEQWILTKCQENLQFAHRCFWFLRAWCLLEPPLSQLLEGATTASGSNLLQYRNPADAASNTSLSSRGSEPGTGSRIRLGSSSSEPALQQNHMPSKFLPEERCLIEALLLRVIECGELSAAKLQYGTDQAADAEEEEQAVLDSSQEDGEASSPSALMSATESGMIPVDPATGFPSVKHMDSVSAQHRYGFLPMERRHDVEMADNGGPLQSDDDQQWFMATPRFLDALTMIADNLFLVPREHRITELRRQLRSLEVELLPSNVVYVPLNNAHHRVWRIVPDESIAISTKERVPCIIYLEVVNYEAKKARKLNFLESALRRSMLEAETVVSRASTGMAVPSRSSATTEAAVSPTKQQPNRASQLFAHMTEREVIDAWQHNLRDPQRHNTFFDKVGHLAQKGLQRLRPSTNMTQSDILLWNNGDRAHSWTPPVSHHGMAYDEHMSDPGDGGGDIESGNGSIGVNNNDTETSIRPPLAPHSTRPPRASSASLRAGSPPGRHIQAEASSGMGQWSSPTSTSNVQRRRAERRRMNQEVGDEVDVMGALVGIRNRMSQHERSDSGTLSDGGSPHYGGTSRKTSEDLPTSSPNRSRPPPVVFRESFAAKEERVRSRSAYGSHPGWRLLPILIKSNDDLRQEQLASQLIYRMASILAREKVSVWLCPYEIVAMTDRGGIIEAIPDTISLDSLKRNDPHFVSLSDFFSRHFGEPGSDSHSDAKASFVESLAAYSMVCFLLQIKDRHNGNILLDNQGHLIHIDFGFFFLSSPGKNSGFESAPFKLTRDFVDLMDGPDSRTFRTFRELCCRTFLSLRRHWYEIIILVEMLMVGNEDLGCFRGRPEEAVSLLRERFRLDLNDRACTEYVNALIDESLENWRTRWYDRYQRYCVGVL